MGHAGRAIVRSAEPGAAAARRAVLAVAGQRPDLHPADADRAERDGHAGPADRLRQHRRPGAGARRVTTRRDRRAAGPRGDPRAHRAAARPREPGARRARAPALGVLLAWQGIPPLVNYAEWLAAPQRLFFNIEVDGLVIAFTRAWRPASARSSSAWSRPCRARGSIWCRSSTRTPRRAGAARGRLRAGAGRRAGGGLAPAPGRRRPDDAQRRGGAARRSGLRPDASCTSVELDVRQNGYDATRGRPFYRQLLETARTDAGVESATLAWHHPLGLLDTRSAAGGDRRLRAGARRRSGLHVNTDRPRLLPHPADPDLTAGREFEDRDDDTRRRSRWSNDTLARRFWGGAASAIGKRIRLDDGAWRTVVGVAADVKYSRIERSTAARTSTCPFFQAYRSSMVLHTRGPGPVDALVDQARARVAALDADMPITVGPPVHRATSGARSSSTSSRR